jgi:hypothetical protein
LRHYDFFKKSQKHYNPRQGHYVGFEMHPQRVVTAVQIPFDLEMLTQRALPAVTFYYV